MRRQLLAWQGVRMVVPETWEVSVEEGVWRRGYLRLDDLESVRAQVRWAPARRGATARVLVDGLAAQFEKEARRARQEITVRRNSRLVVCDAPGAECFECVGPERMVGLALCPEGARRALIVCLNDDGQKDFRRDARRVLASVEDVRGEAELPWALYGFRVALPARYRLRTSHLQVGRLELEFGARGREVHASRISAANVALRKKSLVEWFAKDQIERLKRPDLSPTAVEHRGAEAVSLRVVQRRLGVASRVTRWLAWHQTDDNAIYVAQWRGPEPAEEEFTRFVDSMGNGFIDD